MSSRTCSSSVDQAEQRVDRLLRARRRAAAAAARSSARVSPCARARAPPSARRCTATASRRGAAPSETSAMIGSANTPSSDPRSPNSRRRTVAAREQRGRVPCRGGGRRPRSPSADAQVDENRRGKAPFEVLLEHHPVDARRARCGAGRVARVGHGRVPQKAGQRGRLGALAADVADDQPAAVLVAEGVVEVAADFAAGAQRAKEARQLAGPGSPAAPAASGCGAASARRGCARRTAARCQRPSPRDR